MQRQQKRGFAQFGIIIIAVFLVGVAGATHFIPPETSTSEGTVTNADEVFSLAAVTATSKTPKTQTLKAISTKQINGAPAKKSVKKDAAVTSKKAPQRKNAVSTPSVKKAASKPRAAKPLPAVSFPEGSMTGLCADRKECSTFCADNVTACIKYCIAETVANPLCKEMRSTGEKFGMSLEGMLGIPPFMLSSMAKQMVSAGPPAFDPKAEPLPKLARSNFIDLHRIVRISKFRGGYGHDYSLGTDESCRSMKHYFWAAGGDPGRAHTPPWSTIALYAPADGVILRLQKTGGEVQFALKTDEHPAFSFIFHHVALASGIGEGVSVLAGEKLGTVATDNNHGEIAVEILTPSGRSLVSFFEVASPDVLAEYTARGLSALENVVISRTERDANPLVCDVSTVEGRFTGGSYDGLTDAKGLSNWVELH